MGKNLKKGRLICTGEKFKKGRIDFDGKCLHSLQKETY